MRRFLIILCGVLLVVLCVVLLSVSLFSYRREQTMPDGSVIRIEKVTYGKPEHISLGGPIEKLKGLLTRYWPSKHRGAIRTTAGMSYWQEIATMHSNEPALYIYISRRAPGKGYRSVDARNVHLIDGDGCVFYSTQAGGWDDAQISLSAPGNASGMRYSVGWFRFEAFPRHDKQFRFIVEDYGRTFPLPSSALSSAEFKVSNPAPPQRMAQWAVEPLPQTQTQERVSFILTKVSITNSDAFHPFLGWQGKSIMPEYDFAEDGRPSTNWQALNTEMYDSSGNFVADRFPGRQFLCPCEPAWKLRVKFFGSENSVAASNAAWTLHDVAVPGPGQYTLLDQSKDLQGVVIKAVTFGGPGDFTYSNNVALEAAALKKPIETDLSGPIAWRGGWERKAPSDTGTFDLHAKSPHLAIAIGELTDNQRLTVRAVDNQGREFYGFKVHGRSYDSAKPGFVHYLGKWYPQEGHFVILDLPADAKTVDLTFCIHTCRTVDFIFKPPVANMPPAGP